MICEKLKCRLLVETLALIRYIVVILKAIYLFKLLRLMFLDKTYQLPELHMCVCIECVHVQCVYNMPGVLSFLLNIDIFHCFSEDKSVSIIFDSTFVFLTYSCTGSVLDIAGNYNECIYRLFTYISLISYFKMASKQKSSSAIPHGTIVYKCEVLLPSACEEENLSSENCHVHRGFLLKLIYFDCK